MIRRGQTVQISKRGSLVKVRVLGFDPRGFWVGKALRRGQDGLIPPLRVFREHEVVSIRTPEGFRCVLHAEEV